MPDPSFDPALTTIKDEARQTLGLTDVSSAAKAVFLDSTIQAVIDKYGPSLGVAKLADQLADFFDAQPVRISEQLGATIEFVKERAQGLRDLAKRLRNGQETIGGLPEITGGCAAIAQPEVDTSALRYGE